MRIPPIQTPFLDGNLVSRTWYAWLEQFETRLGAIGALDDLAGGATLADVIEQVNDITQAAKG